MTVLVVPAYPVGFFFRHVVFPGSHLAGFKQTLTSFSLFSWIAAARLLYCFDFEQVAGKEIDTLNINVGEHRWAPFEVKITARSEAHRKLIER